MGSIMSLNNAESIDAVVVESSVLSLIMVVTVAVAADTDAAIVAIVVGMVVGVAGVNAVVSRVAIDIRSGITNSWILCE